MASFSESVLINAPQETVFQACSDFANAPSRIPGIKRVEMLTSGPVGVGTRFKETRVMFKREATEEMEVTKFDRPRSYTLGCQSCGCVFESTCRCEPEAGGTRVTLDFNTKAVSLMAKLMTPLSWLMMGSMKKCIMKDFEDIKASVERAPVAK